ncbi:MAG TPA: PDZ domain-containing protein [Candidatus Kapabacteria bacterium]|jgi:C-terminal processing protease CtpA/Prc|nr:PDZ domain-containing protein [Ignavibacteria bacterium]HRE57659.1 PDZ domain-containing protein [Candidatus Kapabacteria bacterium]HRK59479.1 PDZ domain-containing protein [Candidatus Kapabacteria bacterium]
MYSSFKHITAAIALSALMALPIHAQQTEPNAPSSQNGSSSIEKSVHVIRIGNDGKVSVDKDAMMGNTALINTLSCAKPRPFLGVTLGDAANKGVPVTAITPASAAEKAGLVKGDIIVSIDGKELNNSQEVVECIQSKKAGNDIAIVITRDGQQKNLTATLTNSQPQVQVFTRNISLDKNSTNTLEDVEALAWTDNDDKSIEVTTEKDGNTEKKIIIMKKRLHGDAQQLENIRIELPNINNAMDKELMMVKVITTQTSNPCEQLQELKSNPLLGVYIAGNFRNNVFVENTMKSLGADAVGIQRGDIITSIDGITIKNYNELRREITKHVPGERVAVTYKRNGEEKTVYALLSSQAETKPEIVQNLEQQCADKSMPKAGIQQETAPNTDNGVSVYPNPTYGLSTIRFTSQSTDQLAVTITDMEGREVMTMNHAASIGTVEIPLDVTELSSGIYLVNITQNGQTFIERIVVQ